MSGAHVKTLDPECHSIRIVWEFIQAPEKDRERGKDHPNCEWVVEEGRVVSELRILTCWLLEEDASQGLVIEALELRVTTICGASGANVRIS